ncbi:MULTISPECIES: hypothetical protein [Streptomyces]
MTFENPFAGLKNNVEIKQEKNMSDGKIVTTIKFAAGYDAPWSVLHTESIAEANAIMTSSEFGEYAQNVVTYSKAAQGLWGPVQPPAPAQRPAPAANEATAAIGGGGGKTCAHGAMTYREAKPESGKDWKGYFCPTPKDTPGQCKPQFLR